MMRIVINREIYYVAHCQVPGCGWWDRCEVNNRDARESAAEHNRDAHSRKAVIVDESKRRKTAGVR